MTTWQAVLWAMLIGIPVGIFVHFGLKWNRRRQARKRAIIMNQRRREVLNHLKGSKYDKESGQEVRATAYRAPFPPAEPEPVPVGPPHKHFWRFVGTYFFPNKNLWGDLYWCPDCEWALEVSRASGVPIEFRTSLHKPGRIFIPLQQKAQARDRHLVSRLHRAWSAAYRVFSAPVIDPLPLPDHLNMPEGMFSTNPDRQ